MERLKRDKNTVEARGTLYEFITLFVAVLISNKGLFTAVIHNFIPFPRLQCNVGVKGHFMTFPTGKQQGQRERGGAARDKALPQLPCHQPPLLVGISLFFP